MPKEKAKKNPSILLSGGRSTSGKTVTTIGIMAALKKRGYDVQGFKVGLDYIDPSYHKFITGNPSYNLDGYLMEEESIKKQFIEKSQNSDISIIEGVRGLYEGININTDIGSTYQISQILDLPIILIIDARSITKTAAAIVKGIKNLKKPDIIGVIFNKTGSKRHEEKLEKSVEKYTDIKVLGTIPRDERLDIEMRHLGLVPAKEMDSLKKIQEKIKDIRRVMEENLDIKHLVKIARRYKSSIKNKKISEQIHKDSRNKKQEKNFENKKIALAYDKAFNFYYQANIDLLENLGAKIEKFSPIKDKNIPSGTDGIYIGGGYPELFLNELEDNESMKQSIYDFYQSNKPIYGECGGLMYLMNSINYRDRESNMVGVFNGKAAVGDKYRVVGYTNGGIIRDNILGKKGIRFRGHEFHHSKIKKLEESNFAFKLDRGRGIKQNLDGLIKKNVLACYTHLHFLSHENFPKKFVKNL
ncbi:MAG: Cobyrinic acid ac-diamide synthase CobB [Candidatus Methanohalarchaeum thermophilum]|uniref:Cobyrinate a,c-diamide synthase n=1 Tax=Methanohalarchaeum thermophilum TaxID=1903181 RepID=A0A1Q6DVN6_METT1|nr:MAG: Cobyrinic acid ac-diamide synthase CobB [Candidatus Methanohalarchaeum thermophilum]